MSKRSSPKQGGKPKRAQGPPAALTIVSTGIVVGERARIPSQSGWRGSQLVLVSGFVPPATDEYDAYVKDDPEHGSDVFFRRLHAAVRHRAGMATEAAVRQWFRDNAVGASNDYRFITQAPGDDVTIRMEAIRGTQARDGSVVTEEAMATLVGAAMTPMAALRLFEPASDGAADGHSRRLIFMMHYWTLDTPESVDDQPLAATVYQLHATTVSVTAVHRLSIAERAQLVPIVQDDERVYVQLASDTEAAFSSWRVAAASVLPDIPVAQLDAVWQALAPLSLSMLKSLVQKIIRSRPAHVDFADSLRVTASCALVVAILVALDKQSFNPNGGGIETGLTAMLKRVGVIIPVEDAWPVDRTPQTMLRLACLAAVSSRRPHWSAPASVVSDILLTALASLHSELVLEWQVDSRNEPPVAVPRFETPTSGTDAMLHVSFVVENFLGGMKGDMMMLRAAAQSYRPARRHQLGAASWVMPVWHSLDQHCATPIVYLLPQQGESAQLINSSRDGTHPMGPLFREFFGQLTGFNPRRSAPPAVEQPVVAEFRQAQRDYWRLLTGAPSSSSSPVAAEEDWSVALPLSWPAYALGARSIKVAGRQWLWSLNPDQLSEIRVTTVADRSRMKINGDAAEPPQTDAAIIADEKSRASAIAEAGRLLGAGIVVDERFFGTKTTIRLDDEAGQLYVNDVPWEEARHRTLAVPTGEWGVTAAPCMDRQYADKLAGTLDHVQPGARRLAISLLRSFRECVEFPRPDRNGGAARTGDALPSAAQWGACAAWTTLSRLCPLVVTPTAGNPARFTTPLRFMPLRHMIADALESRDSALVEVDGKTPVETGDAAVAAVCDELQARLGSPPHAHQRSLLVRLMERVVAPTPLRSHFVWLDVGGGKTLLALMFFQLLQRLRVTAPQVCLFLTTSEALASVQRDARALGLPVNVIVSSSDVSRVVDTVKSGVVFAVHDSVKMPTQLQALLPLVGRSLLVVDEVHKAMGCGTIVADSMQFLARVAGDALMMTATPLRNTREEKVLRAWMQMVVDFPCTESQSAFHVALNSMLHQPLFDKVPTQQELVHCGADDPAVYAHVPRRMGGTSDSLVFSHKMATAAYAAACAAADRRMVELCHELIAGGANVWLVCENYAHVERLRVALALPAEQVWSPPHGARSVEPMVAGTGLRYRVGLVPIRVSTGYSATHFNVRVRGVYPSNQANRTQIDGRIARFGQPVRPVRLYTVHAGITTLILNGHINAESFTAMIAELNAK